MSDDAPSFVRGLFAGAIHDDLLFPYPAPLPERDGDEARVVRRLLLDLARMGKGLIDSARFDEEETIPEEVIRALAAAGSAFRLVPSEPSYMWLCSEVTRMSSPRWCAYV